MQSPHMSPAFGKDSAGTWQLAQTPSRSCSSPGLHRECNQVLETLGSLQKALSLNAASSHQGVHRQESDSLWRENLELRSEVRVWQEESATLQRDNAELRLQLAQLRAELDAERAHSNRSIAASRHDMPPQLVGHHRNSTYGGQVQSPPVAPAPRPDKIIDPGGSHGNAPVESKFSHALRAMPDLAEEMNAKHADELVALSARHAEEVAGLHVKHARALEILHEEVANSKSAAAAADARAKCATDEAERRCKEVTAAADAHCKEVVGAADMRCKEVAEAADIRCKEVAGAADLRCANTVADAEARCTAAESNAQWHCAAATERADTQCAAVTADAHMRCSRAERIALQHRLFLERFSTETVVLSLLLHTIRHWRCSTALAHKGNRLHRACTAAHSAIRTSHDAHAKHIFLSAWSSAAHTANLENRRQALDVELLRSRFARHSQLTWLSAQWKAHETCLLVQNLLQWWRAVTAVSLSVAASTHAHLKGRRCKALEHVLENWSCFTLLQVLVHHVFMVWCCLVQAEITRHASRRAADVACAQLSQADHRIAQLRMSLSVARDMLLRQKAFLAFWMAAQAQAYDVRSERNRVAEEHAMIDRVRAVSKRNFDAALELRARSVFWCAWEAWRFGVAAAQAQCAIEAMQRRIALTCKRSRMVVLRIVTWGLRKASLHHIFSIWLRHVCIPPENKRELERGLRGECDRMHARQTALLRDVSEWLTRCEEKRLIGHVLLEWHQIREDSRRCEIENLRSSRDALREFGLNHAHALLISSAARVQSGFAVRACFGVWRRLRLTQRMEKGDEQFSILEAAHARLCFNRLVHIENLSMRICSTVACAYVLVAWTLWKRQREEGALIRELDTLQLLLRRHQEEGQRQLAFEFMSPWLETAQEACSTQGFQQGPMAPQSCEGPDMLKNSAASPPQPQPHVSWPPAASVWPWPPPHNSWEPVAAPGSSQPIGRWPCAAPTPWPHPAPSAPLPQAFLSQQQPRPSSQLWQVRPAGTAMPGMGLQ